MKSLKVVLSILLIMNIVGCRDISKKIESKENIVVPIEGFIYDEKTNHFVNNDNQIWYVNIDNKNIIPKEEYIENNVMSFPSDFIIEDRDNSVWKLSEVNEVIVEVGDSFNSLANSAYSKHYRMNKEWYFQQVNELNNLTDINVIQWHEPFKLPVYIDSKNSDKEDSKVREYYNLIKGAWDKQKEYIDSIDDPKVKQSLQTPHSAAIFESDELLLKYPDDSTYIDEALKKVLDGEQF